MSIYWELMNEMGFDPMAPGPEMEQWQPWSVRGALEVLTGDPDMTNWTKRDSAELVRRMREMTSNGGGAR